VQPDTAVTVPVWAYAWDAGAVLLPLASTVLKSEAVWGHWPSPPLDV